MRIVACFALILAQATSFAAPNSSSDAGQDPFSVAGVTRAEASDFLGRLQSAIRNDDVDAVAAVTLFPLTVRGKSGPKNGAELARHFTEIYTDKVRAAILGQSVDDLFASSQGLTIGHGQVWISGLCDGDSPPGGCKNLKLLIVSVNN